MSAFEVWQSQSGNTDKTIADYLAFLKQPATDATADLTAFEAVVTENENNRKSAETSRANSEISRASAEISRVNSETVRVNAEINRVNAETGRTNSETTRSNSESSRVSEYATLRQNLEDSINQADSLNTKLESITATYANGTLTINNLI